MDDFQGIIRIKKQPIYSFLMLYIWLIILQTIGREVSSKGDRKMNICPICNGLQELNVACDNCRHTMKDCGRVMDYYDDYSAYMEIDHLKLEDGYPDTLSKHKCPHLCFCSICNQDHIVFITE